MWCYSKTREKSEKEEEQSRKDPELPHDYRCNQEWHKRADIDKRSPWVQLESRWALWWGFEHKEWISWDLGLKVKDDKHKLTWRNCCDLSHAWLAGDLTPGQAEPYHRHTTPATLPLQGHPISPSMASRTGPRSGSASIPGECPHAYWQWQWWWGCDHSQITCPLWQGQTPDVEQHWTWLEDIGLEKKIVFNTQMSLW